MKIDPLQPKTVFVQQKCIETYMKNPFLIGPGFCICFGYQYLPK